MLPSPKALAVRCFLATFCGFFWASFDAFELAFARANRFGDGFTSLSSPWALCSFACSASSSESPSYTSRVAASSALYRAIRVPLTPLFSGFARYSSAQIKYAVLPLPLFNCPPTILLAWASLYIRCLTMAPAARTFALSTRSALRREDTAPHFASLSLASLRRPEGKRRGFMISSCPGFFAGFGFGFLLLPGATTIISSRSPSSRTGPSGSHM